ncbi:Sin3 associated polypeptide p18 [Colletotrichum sojae]|uniref:Sin3 associated polypeptide p18 n=1 Tax=Colletotrichum sojae TaxID=2175907 RepID=A0A8H6N4Y7_9PEZI|nr:Sin3 associated polypeptide p18 [Colletotrichum sojae]
MASLDREETTPFLLRLFHKNGSFHRPDEFAARALPPSLSLYTWPTCTLTELAHHVAAEDPSLLPSPSVGTRLAFRLVYPDTRTPAAAAGGHTAAHPKFMVKDLGTVVLGGQSELLTRTANGQDEDVDMAGTAALLATDNEPDKTLADSKFVVGDYVCCAILPPLSDGSVAPAPTARNDRLGGQFGARVLSGGQQPPHNARREGGFGGRQGRDRDRRRPGFGDGGFPEGEWRRGERLPDDPPDRNRRGGRRGDRW